MQKRAIGPLDLCRIDPARNMQRFYSLMIQPTLFGGVSLMRCWGRIGTKGRYKIETFEETDEVEAAFAGTERAKRRRGYVDCNGYRCPVGQKRSNRSEHIA